MRIPSVATVLVVIVSLFCVLPAMADDDKPCQGVDPETEKRIKDRLQKFIDPKEGFEKRAEPWLKALGFESLDQVRKVVICPGFPIYLLPPGKLKSYEKGTDPWPLLTKTNASIYPLVVNKIAWSSATVSPEEKPANAKTAFHIELGDPLLSRRLKEARELQGEDSCAPPSECVAVTIPSLSLHLFGHHREEPADFKLVVLNHVRGRVTKEDFQNAKDVFENLSNEVSKHEYDQPHYTPYRKRKLVPNQ
jgi:hypothetical protein